MLIKLYKHVDNALHYWEAWENNKKGTVHWGVVGTKGQTTEVKPKLFSGVNSQLEKMAKQKLREGYSELEEEHTLMIEYTITGMGAGDDVNKRHKLENFLNELLGWTGLGHCDGGSMGSGTMEVCCMVANADIAKQVIAAGLKGTEFGNYTKIFEEVN